MKKILVLGAGLVSRPLVHYLLKKEFKVKVASRTVSKAEVLVAGFPNGSAESLNVKDEAQLEKLVSEYDLAISLLPYTHHVQIAKLCIKHKKHLVTTSYVSPAMQALHDDAQAAGIMLLNEIGLDPGIDHMSAMKIIHRVKENGGKVVSFRSYCGGLPAMQHNDNPFGYKFSWSPRGVLMAGNNNGQYLKKGETIFVPNRDLFKHYSIIDIKDAGSFEAYPNRDALPYKSLYGLKDAHTVFRSTLRNVGWCYTMQKARELGLFDDSLREDLKGITCREMVLKLINLRESHHILKDTGNFLGIEPHSTVVQRFRWLGLFDEEPLPEINNVMDIFCNLLQKKLSMNKDDLDLIILHHRLSAVYEDKKAYITATLVDTGIPEGDSAMARTVSLPAAIAANLILRGEIDLTGAHLPIKPNIYLPVLKELERMGVKFTERNDAEV
mgnify:CR=1 FL=1